MWFIDAMTNPSQHSEEPPVVGTYKRRWVAWYCIQGPLLVRVTREARGANIKTPHSVPGVSNRICTAVRLSLLHTFHGSLFPTGVLLQINRPASLRVGSCLGLIERLCKKVTGRRITPVDNTD